MAKSENEATQSECIRAVAIALQSWYLIKLSRGFDLHVALETVSKSQYSQIIKKNSQQIHVIKNSQQNSQLLLKNEVEK